MKTSIKMLMSVALFVTMSNTAKCGDFHNPDEIADVLIRCSIAHALVQEEATASGDMEKAKWYEQQSTKFYKAHKEYLFRVAPGLIFIFEQRLGRIARDVKSSCYSKSKTATDCLAKFSSACNSVLDEVSR